MIKRLLFNKRIIPIPVPLRSLDEVLHWLSQTLIKADEEVTKILLDGKDLISNGQLPDKVRKTKLSEESRLEIQADAPLDLAIQSLEAFRNLSMLIERGLKNLAVKCWQLPPNRPCEESTALFNDLALMKDLCANTLVMINVQTIDTTVLDYLVGRLQLVVAALHDAHKIPDWQRFANLLLNKLEPALPEIAIQAESIQSQIYSHISEENMKHVSSPSISHPKVTASI